MLFRSIKSNRAFLIACLMHPEFIAGQPWTGLIDTHLKDLIAHAQTYDV